MKKLAVFRSILFAIVGVVSISLAIDCFHKRTGSYSFKSIYGGDAFTGIQNSAASSANNIRTLSEIVRFGFGSVLLVGGLVLMIVAIPTGEKLKNDDKVLQGIEANKEISPVPESLPIKDENYEPEVKES